MKGFPLEGWGNAASPFPNSGELLAGPCGLVQSGLDRGLRSCRLRGGTSERGLASWPKEERGSIFLLRRGPQPAELLCRWGGTVLSQGSGTLLLS